MTVVTIERLDPAAERQFIEFYSIYRAAQSHPAFEPYTARELRVALQPDNYTVSPAILLRDDDGAAAAVGILEYHLRDNPDLGFIEVFVAPAARRRGFGTQILNELTAIAVRAGRRRLHGDVIVLSDSEPTPGLEFAPANGFTPDLIEAIRWLPLPCRVSEPIVDPNYTLVSWRGLPPERWQAGYAQLLHEIGNEAPIGEVGLEAWFYDAERLIAEQAKIERQGRTTHSVIAVSQQGELAGHTQLFFPEDIPVVYQGDTLVMPGHRGHGLGMALKQQAMIETAELLVGRERIVTWNATTNDHMIAINEKLGFHQVAADHPFYRDI